MLRAQRTLSMLFAGAVILSCSDDPPPTVLQPIDLKKPETFDGVAFDRNLIIESGVFLDSESLQGDSIQRFLGKTPYQRPSFLETYQSNGVKAADAMISAGRQYRINPLVFLVFAQVIQGLVGERNYPFPPDRVEYAFRCGCFQAGNCLPQLAGFDRQVDCLGRALRTAIDDIKAQEVTASGWGPGKTSTTFDNEKVTPANEATAALYDRLPRVNENRDGGLWVFWNIMNHYTQGLEYVGPIGSVEGAWVGEACLDSSACAFEGATCARNYPDGICTASCPTGQCPNEPGKAPTFCAKFRDGGFCFPVCNISAPDCRKGYKCIRVQGVADGSADHVCTPETTK